MRIAQRLAAIELDDTTGGRVPLGASWRERPVVLAFIRHFG